MLSLKKPNLIIWHYVSWRVGRVLAKCKGWAPQVGWKQQGVVRLQRA
jgi:hypothetical protein